jgi:hypothetical protein
VNYEAAGRSKSELYIDFLALVNSGAVDMLDNEHLVRQLLSLERRTSRNGKDAVDHPPHAHDDLCNAAAGVIVIASQNPGYSPARRRRENEAIAKATRAMVRSIA